MQGRLPEFVEPSRLAHRGARLEGALPVGAMERLHALLREGSDGEEVEVELRFGFSPVGVARVDGDARLLAPLVCQRCLQPLELEVRPRIRLSFTQGDAGLGESELAAGYEPWEDEGRVALKALVEQEILLALPDFPKHSPAQCPDPTPNP